MHPKHSTAVKRDGDPAPSALTEAAGRLAPGAGGGVLSEPDYEAMAEEEEYDETQDWFTAMILPLAAEEGRAER